MVFQNAFYLEHLIALWAGIPFLAMGFRHVIAKDDGRHFLPTHFANLEIGCVVLPLLVGTYVNNRLPADVTFGAFAVGYS